MSSALNGKKLLVLGASTSETTLVKRAQYHGAYVIVTDSHTDWMLSPAKYVANEAWNISWSDIDALVEKCICEHVDGVTAGYSEFRVENLIKLCSRLDMPCYLTSEQLEITRDKIKFKDTCRKYGIPVVNEYHGVDEVTRFPVIVKPVDRGGSIGISIANDKESLEKAFRYAMDMSVCKQVIIEDYINTGNKIDLYYGVEAGEITLLSSCDTINAAGNGLERVVQSAWLYPMRKQDVVLSKADAQIRAMIKGMGITYGCIFYSGFILPNDEVVFFECGFRMEGAHQYEYVNRRGLYNFLDLFIFHALLGDTAAMPRHADVNEELKCVILNFYGKKGTIGAISGMDEIAAMEDCSLTLQMARLHKECDDAKAILDKLGMCAFCNEDPSKLIQYANKAYQYFTVRDTVGKDMIYDRINTDVIAGWWAEV